MKKLLSAALVCFLAAASVSAFAIPACPTPSVVQSITLTRADPMLFGYYFVDSSQYILQVFVKADSKADAMIKGQKMLDSITEACKPITKIGDNYFCLYKPYSCVPLTNAAFVSYRPPNQSGKRIPLLRQP